MSGRPVNESRQLAILTGEKTYTGAAHKCGGTERYVKGGGCVRCARDIQTEQRAARLALLQGDAPHDAHLSVERSATMTIDDINAQDLADAMGLDLPIPTTSLVNPPAAEGLSYDPITGMPNEPAESANPWE